MLWVSRSILEYRQRFALAIICHLFDLRINFPELVHHHSLSNHSIMKNGDSEAKRKAGKDERNSESGTTRREQGAGADIQE